MGCELLLENVRDQIVVTGRMNWHPCDTVSVAIAPTIATGIGRSTGYAEQRDLKGDMLFVGHSQKALRIRLGIVIESFRRHGLSNNPREGKPSEKD